ncbi:hypothetical protein [Candidatus Chrysopegis kryptomonas]|uniref:hypothetical protein n=1 Tax=Candidatus Chryseopegocella kryptomonas TaxID=1633643 RepID=UPI001F183426|nr:hypothetical protein [Candidatus Chrysopegis kryptomonas]
MSENINCEEAEKSFMFATSLIKTAEIKKDKLTIIMSKKSKRYLYFGNLSILS